MSQKGTTGQRAAEHAGCGKCCDTTPKQRQQMQNRIKTSTFYSSGQGVPFYLFLHARHHRDDGVVCRTWIAIKVVNIILRRRSAIGLQTIQKDHVRPCVCGQRHATDGMWGQRHAQLPGQRAKPRRLQQLRRQAVRATWLQWHAIQPHPWHQPVWPYGARRHGALCLLSCPQCSCNGRINAICIHHCSIGIRCIGDKLSILGLLTQIGRKQIGRSPWSRGSKSVCKTACATGSRRQRNPGYCTDFLLSWCYWWAWLANTAIIYRGEPVVQGCGSMLLCFYRCGVCCDRIRCSVQAIPALAPVDGGRRMAVFRRSAHLSVLHAKTM